MPATRPATTTKPTETNRRDLGAGLHAAVSASPRRGASAWRRSGPGGSSTCAAPRMSAPPARASSASSVETRLSPTSRCRKIRPRAGRPSALRARACPASAEALGRRRGVEAARHRRRRATRSLTARRSTAHVDAPRRGHACRRWSAPPGRAGRAPVSQLRVAASPRATSTSSATIEALHVCRAAAETLERRARARAGRAPRGAARVISARRFGDLGRRAARSPARSRLLAAHSPPARSPDGAARRSAASPWSVSSCSSRAQRVLSCSAALMLSRSRCCFDRLRGGDPPSRRSPRTRAAGPPARPLNSRLGADAVERPRARRAKASAELRAGRAAPSGRLRRRSARPEMCRRLETSRIRSGCLLRRTSLQVASSIGDPRCPTPIERLDLPAQAATISRPAVRAAGSPSQRASHERAAALDDQLEHAVDLGLGADGAGDRGRRLEAVDGALELVAATLSARW